MSTKSFHRLIMGKMKIDIYCYHLLLSHCRYFDKRFSEMFVEWYSTKNIIFVQTSQSDGLSWQPKPYICKNYSKINSSEPIRWIKLKLYRNVHSISLCKTCDIVFLLPLLRYFGCNDNLQFPKTYHGKNENWLSHYRYFDRSFLQLFVE